MYGLLCVLLITFSLIGCNTNKRLHFQGNTENWKAELTFNIIGNGRHDEEFILTYLGKEELEPNLKYEYKHVVGGGKSELTGVRSHRKEFFHLGGGNGVLPPEDSKVEVIINWNGKTETFALS